MLRGKGIPLALFFTSLLAGPGLAGAETIQLDLKSALDRASEANFQILLGREQVLAQEQATRSTRSGLLPTVTLEASQGRQMSPIIDPVIRSFPGVPDRSYADRFDAVLRTRLALLDTRAIDDFRMSKLTLAATQRQLDNTVQEILQQIAVAYLTHWRNVKRLTVLDATLERDQLLLKIARDQLDAGVATALEVTRAEVRLSTNELARVQQNTTVLESELNLKRILNLPLGADLVLTTSVEILPPETSGFSSDKFSEILSSRADYQSLLTEVERETLATRAARREHLPSVELTGQWGYASEAWAEDPQEQWAIGLGVSLPVFEGFRIDANKRLADSQLRQKEIELADLRSRIEADYRLVLQQVESTYQQVEVARRARDLSLREFELEKIRFEEGVTDNSQVVDAQTSLADAEDTLVEAEFYYYRAFINLARVRGNVRRLDYWVDTNSGY